MAISPGISRAASVAQAYAGGYPYRAAVEEIPATPLLELELQTALSRDDFRYSDFTPEQQQAPSGQSLADYMRSELGGTVGNLFSTSTEGFSLAFAQNAQFSSAPNMPGGPTTKATIRHGISTYELTSAVIHRDLAPRGETVSLTL